MATKPQFVAKFSTPQTTEIMMGTRENDAPYPKPSSPEERRNRLGLLGVRNGSARLRKDRSNKNADGNSRTRREKLMRVEGGFSG